MCGVVNIRQVSRTQCHDGNPIKPWRHQVPPSKSALSPDHILKRFCSTGDMSDSGHSNEWYFDNVLRGDPCRTVIPVALRAVFDQQQLTMSRRSAAHWVSDHAKICSRSLQPTPYAGKQCQYGDQRAWWFPRGIYGGFLKIHKCRVPYVFRKGNASMTTKGFCALP